MLHRREKRQTQDYHKAGRLPMGIRSEQQFRNLGGVVGWEEWRGGYLGWTGIEL
jgi:hypothetical protein